MIAGVDGAGTGWAVVICDDDLARPRGLFISALDKLPPEVDVVGVDVPIGRPDAGQREADRLARLDLGRRRSSVFPCPVRGVSSSSPWEDACALSRRIHGKGLSRQSHAILGKIEQVEDHLRRNHDRRMRVREVHPELSFRKWAGAPMKFHKKKPEGRAERLHLIATKFGATAFAEVRSQVRSMSSVKDDDVVDAFAAAWTAARIRRGDADPYPAQPAIDSCGLDMRIWA
jgi:predicted RNase H-like nuclease